MTDYTLGPASFGVSTVIVPVGGPKTIPALLDFTATGKIEIDGQQVVDQGKISYLQGVYVDNADNPAPLTLIMGTTGQRVIMPANSQGYIAILVPNPARIIASTTPGVKINVQFYNVPIQQIIWKTV